MNERRTRSQTVTLLNKENTENPSKRSNITTRRAFGDISNANQKNVVLEKPILKKEIQPIYQTPIIQQQSVEIKQILSPGLDKFNAHDPQACTEYIKDIFEHFLAHETKYLVKNDFLKKQTDIHWGMRQVLGDWLVDVHLKFELSAETLWLTFNILDRFLELTPIARTKLQLVGTTCLWIAAKYEEIYVPEVKEFVEICANAYTKDDMLKMEKTVLTTLEFNLTVATPLVFLQRFAGVVRCDKEIESAASFLMEKSLLDSNLIAMKPSILAASCLYYARIKKNMGWSFELTHYTRCTEQDLKDCVNYLILMMKTPTKLQAINKKYSSPKRESVGINYF